MGELVALFSLVEAGTGMTGTVVVAFVVVVERGVSIIAEPFVVMDFS